MPSGGKQPGAGRPRAGSPGARVKQETLRKAARLVAEEESPLDALADELRFWRKEIGLLTRRIEQVRPEGASLLQVTGDGRAVVDRLLEARRALVVCAEKAAPYVHPRLAAIRQENVPFDLSKLTDDELDALERIRQRLT